MLCEYIKNRNNFKKINYQLISSERAQFDIDNQMRILGKLIPRFMIDIIDVIYLGDFPELQKAGKKAAYLDGSILIDIKNLSSEKEFMENTVHEIAHAVLQTYGNHILSDFNLEREFLGKREKLFQLLKADLNSEKEKNRFEVEWHEKFLNSEFDKDLDDLFYIHYGYERLTPYIMNLFISSYSPTSLEEYFAVGFEFYILSEERDWLKNISPILYKKIEEIENLPNGDYFND